MKTHLSSRFMRSLEQQIQRSCAGFQGRGTIPAVSPKEALRHAAGRKPAFSLPQIIQMAAMQQQGKSIAEIARTFQVSRQTVYNQIARAHCFSTDPDVKTRMCFLYRDQLCTTIDIDFRHEKIAIQNYTKKNSASCLWRCGASDLG